MQNHIPRKTNFKETILRGMIDARFNSLGDYQSLCSRRALKEKSLPEISLKSVFPQQDLPHALGGRLIKALEVLATVELILIKASPPFRTGDCKLLYFFSMAIASLEVVKNRCRNPGRRFIALINFSMKGFKKKGTQYKTKRSRDSRPVPPLYLCIICASRAPRVPRRLVFYRARCARTRVRRI